MSLPVINNLKNKLLENIKLYLEELNSRPGAGNLDLSNINYSNITLVSPKNKEFGDLCTNAAMVLAPVLKQKPLKIAEILKDTMITGWEEADQVSIAPPGFINFYIKKDFIKKQLYRISSEREKYGFNKSGRDLKVQIEFVSANPTGNLHIGHGRWAALGDSLSSIYEANGYEVYREYYVNDFGSQIKKYAMCIQSLYLRAFGKIISYPEDGYPEELVASVADEIIKYNGNKLLGENTEVFAREGVKIMLSRISATLSSMKVEFDEWFMESSLYGNSNFENTVSDLKQKGIIYEMDDALWFKTSKYGDDKDRVVIRTGGEPTYFASDIMYLLNKVSRGFKKLIYILGADHHGYIKRLHAIGKAINFNDENIKVIIGQLVRLVKKGELVKMSKRKGKVYNLEDLIKEVGSDAVRFFFCANSFDTPLDFDLELAKQKSNKNPVYYVQYAHARIASVIEKISGLFKSGDLVFDESEIGCSAASVFKEYSRMIYVHGEKEKVPGKNNDSAINDFFEKSIHDFFSLLNFKTLNFENKDELELAKILLLYPDTVYDACCNDAPYMINQFLYKLASQFHYFYKHNRIIDENKLNINRFKLILLVRVVLANAMNILKISKPVKM